jgi:1,4-dihydroxy-2-naphthoate octaprenyltransferase
MLLGLRASKVQYAVLAFGSYLAVALLVVFRMIHPLCLSALLTLPLAIGNMKTMCTARIEQLERIRDLDAASARLVLAFSLMLILSNAVAAWI